MSCDKNQSLKTPKEVKIIEVTDDQYRQIMKLPGSTENEKIMNGLLLLL